jgi:hypothetical protein
MPNSFHSNIRVLFATVAAIGLTGCIETEQQAVPLPPLLHKATAGGGWASACPPRSENERKMIETSRLAVSPEVEQRLRDEFPPGSDEDRLIAVLTAQGFKLVAPCETDQTIQRAQFFRKGTGFLPYSTSATIYWKIDVQRRIVWTKGFVSYSGL